MGDTYTELLIKSNASAGAKALKVFVTILAVIAVALTILTFNVLFFTIAVIIFVILYFVNKIANVEYEYIQVNDQLDIDKIFNKISRKKAITLNLQTVEVVAPLGSHSLDSYQHLKVVDYSARDPKQKPFVMVCMVGEEMKKVVLQLDQNMVKSLKSRMPRKVVEY